MKIKAIFMGGLSILGLATGTVHSQTFDIESAADYGGAHANYPASNAIDGNTAFASRWAANYTDGGGDVSLYVDLGSVQTVDDIGVAWGRGDGRTYNFEVRARSGTSGTWTKIRDSADSSGSTDQIEQYNVDDFDARQVRIKIFSTSTGSDWANVTEFEVYGTSGPSDDNDDDDDGNGSDDYSGTYHIKSVAFGGYLRPTGTSLYGEAEITDDSSDARTEWEIIRNGTTDYYYLRNVDTGYNIRPQNTTNEENMYMVPSTWTGSWTQWQIEDNSSYIRFINLSTGYYFRPNSNGEIEAVTTSYTGSEPRWTLEETDGDDDDGNDDDGDFGLDPNDEPWENFDLSHWKLDTPAGEDSASDCDAQSTEPQDWTDFPSRSEEYFFTHTDGGMRFVTEIGGATTGNNCDSRTRSELREMLRGSDTSIDTSGEEGDYRNNWALGYQPTTHAGNSGESWGAREGKMSATLRVNQVTTSGVDSSKGRTVIGQIHAFEDEPLRLNYKHPEGYTGGCVYAASEERGESDTDFILIGNDTSCSSDPGSDGIALGELFSYEIENDDEDIIVTIRRGDRDGSIINSVTIDLDQIDAGYDVDDDWMYFKAGAYSQNSTNDGGDEGDGDIVTFYRLDVEH